MTDWKKARWQGYQKKLTTHHAAALRIQDITLGRMIPMPSTSEKVYAELPIGKGAKVSLNIRRASNNGGYLVSANYNNGHITYIPTDKTPCGFGGFRYWFICPECLRRCGVVYVLGQRVNFACRKCCNLTYLSQQVSQHPSNNVDPNSYLGMALRIAELIDRLHRLGKV